MAEKWMRIRGWLIGISCCALILGVVMVVWPQISATVLCWILGLLSIGVGVHEIIRHSQLGFAGLFFRFDLVLGVCNILIGAAILLPFGSTTFLPFAAGLYVLESSIFNIQLAVSISKYNMGGWAGTLALGIVGVIFSVFLFADPFRGTSALMIFMGVAFIVNGVQGLYDVAHLTKVIKNSEGPKAGGRPDAIDVEWERVD